MTITSHATKLNALQDRIKAKIDTLEGKAAIGVYLDDLESEMIDSPYGDMLFEFAWEYSQARLAEFDAASYT